MSSSTGVGSMSPSPCSSSSLKKANNAGRVSGSGNNSSSDDDEDATSEKTTSSSSALSLEALKAKMELESMEFAFLKPICAQVLQSPSENNLRTFEEALDTVEKVPAHLSEFVMFPFAIHLKVIRSYKEHQRIGIFKTLAKLLQCCEMCNSYDMFVNVFQKLHVALCVSSNLTSVNVQMADEEMESIMDCITKLTVTSLSHYIDTLCLPDKVQIFGHSIYILLQLVGLDVSKPSRLTALDTLDHLITICDGSETRSRVLYKFLPGIMSSLRKICLPSAGHTTKAINQKSLDLMGQSICICTEFESKEALEQPDEMLSQIVELLSKEFILHKDVDYRNSFQAFCTQIVFRNSQLPKCSKTASRVMLQMRGDTESSISEGCVEVLENLGVTQEISFEDLTNLLHSALSHLKSGNDDACLLSLREMSSVITTRKLSFVEFKLFLPMLFQFVNEMVWKFRNVVSVVNERFVKEPVFVATANLCKSLVLAVDVDEVIYEVTSVLSDLQNNPNTIPSPTGVIVTFNNVLTKLVQTEPNSLNEYEAANLAEIYLSIVDMQSTEIAIKSIASDIPAVHTAAEIRRAYLLEGLGILGSAYPRIVVPIVLYPLIEHAGSLNSEAVNEAATLALESISGSLQLSDFLKENLDFILSEVSVRMLNLILHPNCPRALIFLAHHFDFSKESFSGFIDEVFVRCSDEFGGGNVQHIYVQVFYALVKSMSKHLTDDESQPSKIDSKEGRSLMQKLLDYQISVGVRHPSVSDASNAEETSEEFVPDCDGKEAAEEANLLTDAEIASNEEVLDPARKLTLRISQRVLNFLPNSDRSVRLTAVECLILGVSMLKQHEDSLLPLSHTIWQNLVPRLDEKDYVVVRKTFELLVTLCTCCGAFLKKRTLEEAFPRLSTLLVTLAKEGEEVKNKNRQYYTCTQAYKLQLTVLQGLSDILEAIDVQEFELDKIVTGCIMYLRPDQHKNLRDAAVKLLEKISIGKHSRTIWLKLIAHGLKSVPVNPPHPDFKSVPRHLLGSNFES